MSSDKFSGMNALRAAHYSLTGRKPGAAHSAAAVRADGAIEAGPRRLQSGITTLMVSDILTVVITGLAAKFIYLDLYLDTTQPLYPYAIVCIGLSLTLLLFYEHMGQYSPATLTARVMDFGKLWGGLALAFLVLLGILYTLKISEFYSRGWILSWFAFSALFIVITRWQTTRVLQNRIKQGDLRHQVAIYGAADFAPSLAEKLAKAMPFSGKPGIFLTAPPPGTSPGDGGTLDGLRHAMQRNKYDMIIIALPACQQAEIQSAVKSLASYSAELLLCSDLAQYPVVVSGSRTLGDVRLDVINLVPASERSQLAKPLLDYLLAGIGLISISPLLLLIAAAIKLDSPGPVFFRQRRYGQNNRIFRIYKFRTMTVAEDGDVVIQAKRNDQRVTRVGRFLRSSSLDELPQLINVLRGEMSLIGPRPHAVAHDEAFEQQLDLFSRRRRVKPGITGWAQVHGCRGETKTTADIRQRMEYDLHYVDNWSIWLDLEILARTVFILGRRAY